MPKKLIRTISTFFGFGYLPYAPGTFGSAGGLLIYFLVAQSQALHLVATAFVLILGFAVCKKAEKIFQIQDPPQVVIDEVAGMLISLMFLPKTWPVILCVFILFRGFDTIKIWPTDKLEKVPNGAGIMLDDVMAGVYANLCIQLVLALVRMA